MLRQVAGMVPGLHSDIPLVLLRWVFNRECRTSGIGHPLLRITM
jgi:hypothetical protein